MKATIKPIITTTTEFMVSPPYGYKTTHPKTIISLPLFFYDAPSPPLR
jgi:hypothetical protein